MSLSESSYLDLVRRRCAPHARAWWDSVLDTQSATASRSELSKAYSQAVRTLGSDRMEFAQQEIDSEHAARFLAFQERPLHEFGRAALLLFALELLPADEHVEFVDNLFMYGNSREQEALLRALSILPDQGRFLLTAVEACRANVQTVFEAIACENSYPGCYFPESNFNQMVLKAIYTGVSLRRVVGLPDRITPTLKGMASDHIKERTAAGRPVHEDIALIMNP
jgi:hypothetical protein